MRVEYPESVALRDPFPGLAWNGSGGESSVCRYGPVLLKRQPTVEEFEEAALPHLNDLHRVATRSLADPTKADDVVQEAFLRAWKSFHQFRPGTNCRAWMFRILFNCIHDYRSRSSKLIAVGDDEIPLEQRLVHTEAVPERLTDEDVLSALDRIPPDFRAAVLLADVEELSYKEIAEVLGIRMGTVMSRLSRGRKLLRVGLAGVARSYGIRKAAEEAQSA